MDSRYVYSRRMQIQKDRFLIWWIQRDLRKDSPTRRFGGNWDWCCWRTALCRVYLLPSCPDNLIRPGLFQCGFYDCLPTIAVLSFHGKYARVTSVVGEASWMLQIHLVRHIQLRGGVHVRVCVCMCKSAVTHGHFLI